MDLPTEGTEGGLLRDNNFLVRERTCLGDNCVPGQQ